MVFGNGITLKGRKQSHFFIDSFLGYINFVSPLTCSVHFLQAEKHHCFISKLAFISFFLPLYSEPLFSYLFFPISHSHSSILALLQDPSFYLTPFFFPKGQTSDVFNLTKVSICIWIHTALCLLNSLQPACSQSTYTLSACLITLLPFTSFKLVSSVTTTKLCNYFLLPSNCLQNSFLPKLKIRKGLPASCQFWFGGSPAFLMCVT